jgi:co-chaperonin GroES (HSP10)
MKALFYLAAPVFVLNLAVSATFAQPTSSAQATQATSDPNVTPNGAIGEVKVADVAGKQLIMKTDAGSLVTVVLNDATQYMRVAPGEKTLTNATKIALADVGEGDRVFARGATSDDRKTVTARAVVVMSKADIAKKQEAERAEWKRRGILGIITAVKPETKEITISTRAGMGQQAALIIPVSDKVEMRRYAPDSIKFADAKPATFEELKVGDQVRALGERAADGTAFSAEKVVTGSFKTVAGVVTAIDAATGEVKINDMQTKQPLTIVVKQDAVLRKFPSEMGGMMMMGRGPGGAGPGAQAGAGAPGGAAGPGGGPGARAGGGGVNVQDMLERLPTIAIAEVKVGDTIIVSSTKGADPTRLTAITLISGADTLLNMMAARQPQASGQSAPNPAGGLGNIPFGMGLP